MKSLLFRRGVEDRIVGGFLVLILCSFVSSLAGIYSLRQLRAQERLLVQTEESRLAMVTTTKDAVIQFKMQVQSWKDILLRGNDPEKFAKYKTEFLDRTAKVDELLDTLRAQAVAEGLETEGIDGAKAAHQLLQKSYLEALEVYDTARATSYITVDQLVKGIDRPATTQINALAEKMAATMDGRVKALEQRTARDQIFYSTLLLAAAAVALGLSLWIGLGLARQIGRSLRRTSAELAASAEETAAAADQVASASEQLSSGANEQAASLQRTVASVEQIAGMTRRNAENAGAAHTLSAGARDAVVSGAAGMAEMREAMEEITGAVAEMDRAISGIRTSSADVAKIVKTIDEIAFQTNILALNASVEAARAGTAGAGFAVVADEVRSLASRSATAARETARMIENAVAQSTRGVEVSGKVAGGVADVARRTEALKAQLDGVASEVVRVDALISEIASAAAQQSLGLEEVNREVLEIDRTTQLTASSAEESAAAARELSSQSEGMYESVGSLEQLVVGTKSGTETGRQARLRVELAPGRVAALRQGKRSEAL